MRRRLKFVGMIVAFVAAILWLTKPPAQARACFGKSIAKGATKTVPAGYYIDGDVKIGDVQYTGKRLYTLQATRVTAPYGASYIVAGCQGHRNAQVVKVSNQVQTQPTAQPSTPAAPTKTPVVKKTKCEPVPLQAGANLVIPGGYVIDGDIKLNGVPQYDNDPNTGTRVVLNQSAFVFAEWGATVVQKSCEPALTKTTSVVFWNGGSAPAPVTTVAQSPTPAPPTTVAPTSTTVPCGAYTNVLAGQIVTVPEGSVIDGDVKTDGVAQYDNDSATKLRVYTLKNTTVTSDYAWAYTRKGCETPLSPNTIVKTW